MAKLFEKMRNAMFGDFEEENDSMEQDSDYDYYEEPAKEYETDVMDIETFRSQKKMPSMKPATTQEQKVHIVKVTPKTFEEVRDYCDCVKAKKIVVINLSDVDHALKQRIMDFLCGACYALEGSIEKGGNDVFIIAHRNADISALGMKDEYNSKNMPFQWASSFR